MIPISAKPPRYSSKSHTDAELRQQFRISVSVLGHDAPMLPAAQDMKHHTQHSRFASLDTNHILLT